VTLADDAPPLADLRRARRIVYDVAANWKIVTENYSECYHCPGVHPDLNRLTPTSATTSRAGGRGREAGWSW